MFSDDYSCDSGTNMIFTLLRWMVCCFLFIYVGTEATDCKLPGSERLSKQVANLSVAVELKAGNARAYRLRRCGMCLFSLNPKHGNPK